MTFYRSGHILRYLLCVTSVLLATAALAWEEPARGSPERRAMMDAVRPQAERVLGAPVEFVVDDLRVAVGRGFAALRAQRPGGGAIDLYATPGARRGDFDPATADGATVHVLYQKSGSTWVAMDWSIGATDVWFAAPEYCAAFRAVIRDYCGN